MGRFRHYQLTLGVLSRIEVLAACMRTPFDEIVAPVLRASVQSEAQDEVDITAMRSHVGHNEVLLCKVQDSVQ